MKHFTRYSLFILLLCFLCACKSTNSTEEIPDINPASLTSIPVLTIETVSDDKNVMRFVTSPVASHVSEAIASWTPGYVMPPAPYYEACTVTLTDADQTVLLDKAAAQVKVRGNWTTSYEKKPLRIKFEESQNLLGLNDGATFKNWLLLAEYKDVSMLRNKTALSIAEELLAEDGLYVSDAELVEVVINGQYWGVYLLAEQQQINKDRVNITEAEAGYTGTDIGYFMEFDRYYMNENELQQFFVDYADNAPLVPFDGNDGSGRTMTCLSDPEHGYKKDIGITIKSDIYSAEQRDFIASFVNHVYDILYAAAYDGEAYIFNETYTAITKTDEITPWEAVEQVLNVNSLADAYLINELLCDADVCWSSFFLSADFGPEGDKKLTFEAPWDFDSAMGNKDRCTDGTGFYAANIVPDVNGNEYETINPWLAVLMYMEEMQTIIRDKWTAAYDSGVFERANNLLKKDLTRCKESFDRNYTRWNNLWDRSAFSSELSWESAACVTHEDAVNFLSEWLYNRVEFLNSYWHR